MRVHEERKTSIYRDEEDWPDFTMVWGGLKRPVKFRPTSVTIDWHRKTGEYDWTCWSVDVFGDRVRYCAQAIAHYARGYTTDYQRQMWAKELERQQLNPAPHDPQWKWLDALVAASFPAMWAGQNWAGPVS